MLEIGKQKYDRLIKATAALLKSEGFVKKNADFYLPSENHWGIIQFQKSQSSTRDAVKFTINIGVQSKAVARKLGYGDGQKPHVSEGHWHVRVGELLPQKQDHWWVVDRETSEASLIEEIHKIVVTLILPAVKMHMDDAFLKQRWLAGVSAGITDFQRYVYLMTILRITGDDRLEPVMDEFNRYARGKSMTASAKEYVILIMQ